jgi:hypothetical protein
MSTGRFCDPLVTIPMADGVNWIVAFPFRYLRDRDDPSSVLTAPLGFQTDFTSTPRAVWALLPPWARYGAASLIHDVCYRLQPNGMSREEADRVLLEAMECLDVPEAQRLAIYEGVRIGGQAAWNENAVRYAAGERWTGFVPVIVTRR